MSNLTCSQIFWLFDFFLYRLILAESTAEYNRKEVTFWIWCCQRCEFYKSIICDLRSLMNKSMQFLSSVNYIIASFGMFPSHWWKIYSSQDRDLGKKHHHIRYDKLLFDKKAATASSYQLMTVGTVGVKGQFPPYIFREIGIFDFYLKYNPSIMWLNVLITDYLGKDKVYFLKKLINKKNFSKRIIRSLILKCRHF